MKTLFLFVTPMLLLTACMGGGAVEEPVRAVKTLTVSEASDANSRQIAGVVKAANESELSFQVGGRIAKVEVKAGDSVVKDQVLSALEQKNYTLALEEAQANLAKAKADLIEKKNMLQRQKNLKKKDFVSQAAVDQAQAAYQAAESSYDVAQTRLKTARNDLDETVLRAPFSGRIAKRLIDPFVEIAAGKTAFELQGEGGYEVEVLVPETLIRDINYGDPVQVRFPTLKKAVVSGKISQIGAQAETGNAFIVTVELARTFYDIFAGMTAQVTFNLGEAGDAPVYLIPVSALDVRIPVEGEKSVKQQATVYVFNPDLQVVEKRKVSIRDIFGNKLEVEEGLKSGDMVIVAGVPFLTDGQKVKQWKPAYNVPATINLSQ